MMPFMTPTFRFAAPLHHEPHPRLQWIEVATSLQIPSFHIVGLPSREVDEARERVRAAIEASQFEFPRRRVVLNLSPAHIRKQGTSLDLAMALSILAVSVKKKNTVHTVSPQAILTLVACGELGLDGKVKTTGQITRTLYAAWEGGSPFLFLPKAEWESGVERLELIKKCGLFPVQAAPTLIAVSNLREAWEKCNQLKAGTINQKQPKKELKKTTHNKRKFNPLNKESTDSDTPLLPLFNPALERILGTAAAGCHHLLLLGSKGSGKSQALESLTALQLQPAPAIHLEQILLSEINLFSRNPLSARAPLAQKIVRRVGLQVRPSALMGSIHASSIRPGEFSLAHGGLLIADELPEWPRDSREALREPLERGVITLTRSRASIEMPAQFTLAGSGNFCPCGGWPPSVPLSYPLASDVKPMLCQCPPHVRKKYLSKLSGPLLDRVDIVFLMGDIKEQISVCTEWDLLKKKVRSVRENLIKNWGQPPGRLEGYALEKILKKYPALQNHSALQKSETLRSRHKILRLSLSLAAWDGKSEPSFGHLVEASCFRPERYGLNN
jgi:magnesium chelatase family protein